jgi:hypothetical protein
VFTTQRPVETGLWAFFIDNFPTGQALIRHPGVYRLDLMVSADATYPPMRKVFCDRKVVSSTNMKFYRVQGTKGWVVDAIGKSRSSEKVKKRGSKSSISSKETAEYISMMLPENKVKTGMFAYKCLHPVFVHIQPKRQEKYKTLLRIEENELIVADLVRQSVTNEGTFARLTDGSGWVQVEIDGENYLEAIPVERGSWVLHDEHFMPVQLLCQPILRHVPVFESRKEYDLGDEVVCDRRIECDNNVFFRVKGIQKFVSGRELIIRDDTSEGLKEQVLSWTPDFVRGIASLVDGVKEIQHDEEAQTLSFSTSSKDWPVVNVYYATRMVGSSAGEFSSGNLGRYRRNCSPPDVAEILKDPSVLAKSSHNVHCASEEDVNVDRIIGDAEETCLRQELVDCYVQSEELKKRQLSLLTALKHCDDTRAEAESDMKQRASERMDDLDQLQLEQVEMSKQHDSGIYVCGACGFCFKDSEALDRHCKSLHLVSPLQLSSSSFEI